MTVHCIYNILAITGMCCLNTNKMTALENKVLLRSGTLAIKEIVLYTKKNMKYTLLKLDILNFYSGLV